MIRSPARGRRYSWLSRTHSATKREVLAVLWDTFTPLTLTPLARALAQPDYALSWSETPAGV